MGGVVKIFIAGADICGLYAGLRLGTALPGAQVIVAGAATAQDAPGEILSNPVLPHLALDDADALDEILAAAHVAGGLRVMRADGAGGEDIVIPGLMYRTLAPSAMEPLLRRRALEAGCELRATWNLQEASDADLVVATDAEALTAMAGGDASEPSVPDATLRLAVFPLAGAPPELGFGFAARDGATFQAMLVPGPGGAGHLLVEDRREDPDNMDASGNDCAALFAPLIGGACVLPCAAGWRPLARPRAAPRQHGRTVAIGAAATISHPSVGLQLRFGLEDADALARALAGSSAADMAGALAAWSRARERASASLLRAGEASAEWLAGAARAFHLPMAQFAFACATRSLRLTYAHVRRAAPDFADRLDALVAGAEPETSPAQEPAPAARNAAPPPMFAPYRMRGLDLGNRLVFSPMCMYSAVDGAPTDFHLTHLGARAVGGFGLVIAEMTNVTPQGRMTPGCAGMYAPTHTPAWKRITDFVHTHTQAKIGIQLAHAGRKGAIGRSWEKYQPADTRETWETIAPSAIPFTPDRPIPREMSRADIAATVEAFVSAARMSDEAGFDMIELHMAHGYLLSSFISPLSNRRTDAYGGDLRNRMRFPLETFEAVRAAFPDDKPISVRISASDYRPDGVTPRESIVIARMLREAGCDIVAVSSAGVTADRRPAVSARLYQLAMCEAIRHEAQVAAMAIGGIVSHGDCNMIVASGRANLCAMARGALNDPYFPHHAAREQGYRFDWPLPYARADETIIRNS